VHTLLPVASAAYCKVEHGRADAEMRDDHAASCHSRGDLAQALGDVFVGESMKPVASDALGIKTLRNGVMVRDGAVAVMKGGVEAGNLKQLRTALQQRVDRRQVVWLMRGAGGEFWLKFRQGGLVVYAGRLLFGPAMNDPVTNRQQV